MALNFSKCKRGQFELLEEAEIKIFAEIYLKT
jgi:hypothetical protein